MSAPTPAAVKKTLDEKRASGITPPVAIASEKKFTRPEHLTQRPFSQNPEMKKLRDSMNEASKPGSKRARRIEKIIKTETYGLASQVLTEETEVRKDAKENN